jgi:CRISPR type III-A-associated RAMP protein Csm4
MLIRLKPLGPWRIGPDSGDRDRVDRIFHSDSLYSAVTSGMARLGALDAWLDATARAAQPAVRFSSCFPYQGDTLFAAPPRNLWPPPASPKVRWKGARFVPLRVVESLAAGRGVSEDAWMIDGPSECLIPMNPPGGQGPFRVAVRSSAAVDRNGAGVEPHSTACLEFAPDGGLWAMASIVDPEWRERVIAVLRLLADSGFGGKRSLGWGRAELTVSDQDLPKFTNGRAQESAWWILSLFHPSQSDAVEWQNGNYSLTTRTGRVESPEGWGEPKRPLRMISEGSVLITASEPQGTAADVSPPGFPHPVYRAGFALAVPIPLKPETQRQRPDSREPA